MAVATVASHVSSAQPAVITSEEISRYSEITSQQLSQLEAQQKALRNELLEMHEAGAEQETGSPYLLAFVDQVRRTVDWKNHALHLGTKLYGIEKAEQWKLRVEVAAPAQTITQIRIKPNPAVCRERSQSYLEAPGCLNRDAERITGKERRLMPQPTEEIALHICPKCRKDFASGRDARGLPAPCFTCDGQRKLLAARLRILPSFRHTAAGRIQRRGQCE